MERINKMSKCNKADVTSKETRYEPARASYTREEMMENAIQQGGCTLKSVLKSLADIPTCGTCLMYSGGDRCCTLYGKTKKPWGVGCRQHEAQKKQVKKP